MCHVLADVILETRDFDPFLFYCQFLPFRNPLFCLSHKDRIFKLTLPCSIIWLFVEIHSLNIIYYVIYYSCMATACKQSCLIYVTVACSHYCAEDIFAFLYGFSLFLFISWLPPYQNFLPICFFFLEFMFLSFLDLKHFPNSSFYPCQYCSPDLTCFDLPNLTNLWSLLINLLYQVYWILDHLFFILIFVSTFWDCSWP